MKDQPTEVRHTIGAAGSFSLRTVAGNVRVRAADTEEAVVTARAAGGEPRLSIERGPGRLAIELPKLNVSLFGRGFGMRDASIDFEVELPKGARLNLAGVSADIVVEGMGGEQSYKSVSGNVTLAAIGGVVSARSVSGDFRLQRGGSVELDVVTTSGDIEVETALLEQLAARSVSGDVDIVATLRPGPRHSVETVSGDLRLRSGGGVTVQLARALDIGRGARRPIVIGDGAAQLVFRSMSGEERIGDGKAGAAAAERTPVGSKVEGAHAGPIDRLDVLRALERGEIDVDEAYRQLEGVSSDA